MNKALSTERLDVFTNTKEREYEAIFAEAEMFDQWDVNSLVTLLIQHYHFDTRKNIICIYDLAHRVSVKHGYMHPELSKLNTALFHFFDDLLFHLKKEEQILFPNIIHLIKKVTANETSDYTRFGLVKGMVSGMQNENDAIVEKLTSLRRITHDFMIPGDACLYFKSLFEKLKEFERNLLLYIHLENEILFPKAIQMEADFAKHFIKRKLETNSLFLKRTH